MAKTPHTPSPQTQYLQVIKARQTSKPNITLEWSELKHGRDVYKAATLSHIKNPATGETRHHQLSLDVYNRQVGGGFEFDNGPTTHVYLAEEEIVRLANLLKQCNTPLAHGDHVVLPVEDAAAVQRVLDTQLGAVVKALAKRPQELLALPELGNEGASRMVAAALRTAHRSNALAALRTLIEEDAEEKKFQRLLDANWWMLGGQYVERIPSREWTLEETLDMLLRSADSYFDIIELKRSNPGLFKRDHDKWIVSAEVNDAVNQAAHYISEIEANRSELLRRRHVDLYKLKAKVILGYIDDNEDEQEEKRQALRMYNSHLHRIQVITYDELVRIGEHVVEANRGEIQLCADANVREIAVEAAPPDDMPFYDDLPPDDFPPDLPSDDIPF